jgi:hypothetical protein
MRKVVTSGTMPSGLFLEVIDDYYRSPEEVRRFALSCTYAEPFAAGWNGLQSIERAPQTQEVFRDLARRAPATGKDNWEEIEASYRVWGRPSAGTFALLLAGQSDNVHFHVRSGAWAGVCYLSLPPACSGRHGVVFYRHKETGATSFAGAGPEQMAMFRRDGSDPEKWEPLQAVPMAFNRMVLYNGRFFHAASPGFGRAVADGHLTQVFDIDFR